MACPGISTSSFSLKTQLHPYWRAVRHADLIITLLYVSNSMCSTCVVFIISQILATTAVENADTFAGGAGHDTAQSAAINNGDDRRLCVLLFTQNVLFTLHHILSCCPHVAVTPIRVVLCGDNSNKKRLSVLLRLLLHLASTEESSC